MTGNATHNFEAFDLVASALEELEIHEATVKKRGRHHERDAPISTFVNDEKSGPGSGDKAVENARLFLEQAVTKPQSTSGEDQRISMTDKQPSGDPEYFKAHYLIALTDYFRDSPDVAANFFKRILNPPDSPDTSAHLAAKNAHATATASFLHEVRYNLGAAYFQMELVDEALKEFEGVIQSTQKRDLAWELLARSAKVSAHRYTHDIRNARREMREVNRQLMQDATTLL